MRPLPAKTSFLCESLFDITTAATYLMEAKLISATEEGLESAMKILAEGIESV